MDDLKYPEVDPSKRSPQQIWDERYSGPGYLFGKEPSPFLKSYWTFLKKGRSLEIGIGEGRQSVFLAGQGFQAEGLDCSSKAIEKARQLAAEKKVELDVKTANLDFFLMPLMRYDTIVMSYFKPHSRFFNEVRRGLAMGGTFFFEAYSTEHLRLNPKHPYLDFEECYRPGEVLGLLKDLHVLYYKELPEGNYHCIQAIAMKSKV